MIYTEIREYEGYVNLPEDELRHLVMMGDVIAHVQHDQNRIRENVIGTNAKIRIIRVKGADVERERKEIEGSGILYGSPPMNEP